MLRREAPSPKMMPRRVIAPADRKAERRQARQGKGTLQDRQIGPKTRIRYETALWFFFRMLPYVIGSWPEAWDQRDVSLGIFLNIFASFSFCLLISIDVVYLQVLLIICLC